MATVKKKTVVELSFEEGELATLRTLLIKLTAKEVGYNKNTLTVEEVKILDDLKLGI